MNGQNNLFQKMCKEAIAELASGEGGWKKLDTNTLILACFGMLTNHLAHAIARPLWWFAAAVGAGIIGYLAEMIMTA